MKVIPKYQLGNKAKKLNYEWTRLRTAKGYVYAKTRNGQAIEYSPNGFFRVYEKPDSNSHSYETTFENASEGNIPSVQRKPDNHAAAVAQQKEIDEKVDAITPGAEDLFTAGTLGGMNNLSPTQWVRRAYDLGEAIKGNMSWDKFGNSWFYGNNGVLSDEYARENSNAAMAINLAGDVAAFGGAGLLRRMPTYYRMMLAENLAFNNMGREILAKTNVRDFTHPSEAANPTTYITSDASYISGPKTPIENWNYSEPGRKIVSSKYLKRRLNLRKREVMNYVKGEEFKQRIMNSGKFTENDYNDLLKEIEYVLLKSRYLGRHTERGAANTYQRGAKEGYDTSYITLHDNQSKVLLEANMWHELWHSIGGRNKFRNSKRFPQLFKMLEYNNTLPILESDIARTHRYSSGDDWFINEIIKRPREVRSRASTFLLFLREKGYDTKKLLLNPNLLNTYLNDILYKKIDVPSDVRQLLQSVDYSTLKNYLSKVLGTTTAAAYIENNYNN